MAKLRGAFKLQMRPPLNIRGVRLLLIVALLSYADFPVDAAPKYKGTESEIKTAYLYNFALFTKWPTAAFETPNSPFIIAILGDDPFESDLEKGLARANVGSRSIEIRRVPSGGSPPKCHLLYISNSEKARVDEILDEVKGKPVLTVAEIDPFCRIGGSIRFMRGNKTIVLRINPKRAESQGLKISSDLLAIAEIIEEKPGNE